MIELRWLERDNFGEVERVLQYRLILSDEAKLGIQTHIDAQAATEYQRWRDVPVAKDNGGS